MCSQSLKPPSADDQADTKNSFPSCFAWRSRGQMDKGGDWSEASENLLRRAAALSSAAHLFFLLFSSLGLYLSPLPAYLTFTSMFIAGAFLLVFWNLDWDFKSTFQMLNDSHG